MVAGDADGVPMMTPALAVDVSFRRRSPGRTAGEGLFPFSGTVAVTTLSVHEPPSPSEKEKTPARKNCGGAHAPAHGVDVPRRRGAGAFATGQFLRGRRKGVGRPPRGALQLRQ